MTASALLAKRLRNIARSYMRVDLQVTINMEEAANEITRLTEEVAMLREENKKLRRSLFWINKVVRDAMPKEEGSSPFVRPHTLEAEGLVIPPIGKETT